MVPMQSSSRLNASLWTLQVLLGLFFGLASGAPKLILPIEQLSMPLPLPHAFVVAIGVAEMLGALGLILPGLTRVRPWLTPLAAACLVLLTICASVYQVLGQQPGNAVFALVIGALAGVVAYARWRVAPLGGQPLAAAQAAAAT